MDDSRPTQARWDQTESRTSPQLSAEPMTRSPIDVDGFRASMRDVGVEEIVDPTLVIFVEEAKTIFCDLSAAVSSGDLETVRVASHKLKSSSGNVWAHDLAALLEEIESAAISGDFPAAAEIFSRAKPEYEAVISKLASLGASA